MTDYKNLEEAVRALTKELREEFGDHAHCDNGCAHKDSEDNQFIYYESKIYQIAKSAKAQGAKEGRESMRADALKVKPNSKEEFPIGERPWCMECLRRINKRYEQALKNIP